MKFVLRMILLTQWYFAIAKLLMEISYHCERKREILLKKHGLKIKINNQKSFLLYTKFCLQYT